MSEAATDKRLWAQETRGERQAVLCLLFLGLLLRVGFAAVALGGEYDPYARLGGDTEKYLAIGLSLSRGEGFSSHYGPVLSEVLHGDPVSPAPHVPTAARSPGYPLFLALVFATFGTDLRLLVLLQAIASTLTPLFVYLIARELKACPILCLSFAVFYYPFAFDPVYVMGEWIFTLCTAASLWLLVRPRSALIAGLVAGTAVLIKSVTLPFLLLTALIPGRRGRTFLVGLACVVGPWGYRNYLHTGVPRVTPSYGGEVPFLLHNPLNRDFATFDRPGDINEYYPGFQDTVSATKKQAPRVIDPVAQEYLEDRELYVAALRFIRDDPFQAVRAVWRSLRNTWLVDYPAANRIRRLNSLLLYLGLLPFGLWGLVQAIRRGPTEARLLAGFLLYFAGVHSIFVSEIRYRGPAMPAYFVVAGLGIAEIKSRLNQRRAGTSAPRPVREGAST